MERAKIKELFLNSSVEQLEKFYNEVGTNYLIDERVVKINNKLIPFPASKGEIIVYSFQCNERISFNNIPGEYNNDLLCILQYVEPNNWNRFTFNVTVDPYGKKPSIAHLVPQIYRGNIGYHRQSIFGRKRLCIRSDYGTWYKRTDSAGNVIGTYFGCIGINIHDNNGAKNSSLGCIILESQKEYINIYKPLLSLVTNDNRIPIVVLNADIFEEIDYNNL